VVVSVERSIPVSTLCTVTVAPDTVAPLVSVTVPRIDPRNVCADALVTPTAITNNIAHTTPPRTPHRRDRSMVFSCDRLQHRAGALVPSRPQMESLNLTDDAPSAIPHPQIHVYL